MKAAVFVMLLYPAVSDLKWKSFYAAPETVFALVLLVIRLYSERTPEMLLSAACGTLPGIFLLLLSRADREAVGEGDGLMAVLAGSVIGFSAVMEILVTALIMAGLSGLLLVLFRKADRKTELPFMPFMLTGYSLVWLLGGLEGL